MSTQPFFTVDRQFILKAHAEQWSGHKPRLELCSWKCSLQRLVETALGTVGYAGLEFWQEVGDERRGHRRGLESEQKYISENA